MAKLKCKPITFPLILKLDKMSFFPVAVQSTEHLFHWQLVTLSILFQSHPPRAATSLRGNETQAMFAFKASATASFRVTTKEDTQKTSEKFDSQQPGFKEIQQTGQHQVYKLVILMTHDSYSYL